MLETHIDSDGILTLEPISPLTVDDFRALSEEVDDYLAVHVRLRGVLVHALNFPGWDSFAGLMAHLRFARDHQCRIERIALVTDNPLGSLAKTFARYFLESTIQHFAYTSMASAEAWLHSEETHEVPVTNAPY